MIFRNMRLKYYEAAGDDGAAGGGNGGGEDKSNPADKAPPAGEVTTDPAKDDKAKVTTPAAPHDMDQYVEQYATDKPALSLALGFLKSAGISPNDPAFQMAETAGDFTLLEAMLAQKGMPGTEQMLGILKGEVEAHMNSVAEAEAKTEEQVAGILGDAQEDILEWARETATPEEKEAINSMFDAGGVYAAAAAIMLRENYSSTVNPTKPAAAVVVNPRTPKEAVAMTASEYSRQVQELAKKYGGDPRNTAEYAAITQKRAQARSRGI